MKMKTSHSRIFTILSLIAYSFAGHAFATNFSNSNLVTVDFESGNLSYQGSPLSLAPYTLSPESRITWAGSTQSFSGGNILSMRFKPTANRTITLVADPNNAATWSMANFPLDGVLWVQSGKLEVDINNPNAVNWSGNRARLRLTQGTTFKTHRANVVVSALVHDDRSSDTGNSTWNSWAETTNELLYPTTGGTVEIGYDDGGTYAMTDSAMSGALTINTTDRSQDAVFSGRVSQPAYLRAYSPFSEYPRLYKTGAGKQIFIGNNSGFLGTAEINGGTLQLGDGSQNSFWGGSITVASGGTFQFKPSAVESAADIGRYLKISLNGTLKLPLAANPTLQPVLDVLANNSTSSPPVSSATDYLFPNSPSKQWPYLEFETAIGSTPLPGCYVLIRCPRMESTFAGNMKTRQPIPNHLLDFKMAIHTPGGKRITAAFAQLLKINEPALVVQSNTEGYEVITDASGNLTTRITHIPRDSNYALPAASGGSSSSAPITLRNYGTGLENPPSTNTYRIQINEIRSDNSEFSVGSLSKTNLYQFYSYPTDTPPTVATENNGSATITFTPASGSVGLRNANITISYQHILPSGTDPTVYTYRFTVSAMATPQISLTNQAGATVGSSLLMGRLSATTTTDLNLRNNGSIALNNLNLQILGTDAAAFTATLLDQAGTSVISSLPSATTGTLRLTYNPDLATDYGLSTATLMIRQGTDPAFSTIALSAIRVASLSAPVLQIIDTRDGSRTVLSSNPATPSTVAVPDTVLGRRCATQSLTMRNIGSAVLNISAASLSSGTVFSNATPDLSIAAIDNNGLVDSAPLQVTFTPLPLSGPIPIGTYSDQISVTYNSPGAVYTINLQGDSLNGPFLRVEDPSATPATVLSSNSSYSLPTTFLGSNSQRSLTLRNIGTLPLTFNAPTFSNAAEFSLRNSQGAALTAFSIQGSSSTEALVRLTPTAVGTRSSSLSLTSNSPNSPFALNLTANVTANAFALTDGASPPASVAHNSSIRLPNAVIGASSTATYTLTNTTASALNVTTGLSGSGATEFDAVLRDGMGTVITELGGNSSATLTLSFRPTDNSNSSARTCNLAIGSGPGTTFALQLSATPDAAPLQITTSNLPEVNTLIAYSTALTAQGGFTPYTWALSAGSLPSGLSMGSNGVISGTVSPQADNTFQIRVRVTDALNISAEKDLTLSLRTTPLTLRDQATPPSYLLNQASINLPNTIFGGSNEISYTLTNTTAAAINVATVLSGADASEFSAIVRTSVGGVMRIINELDANSSATLTIAFQPTDNSKASARACLLTISNRLDAALTLHLGGTPLAAPLQINTSSLPAATSATAYTSTLSAQGGLTPYTWSLTAGSLPSGLSLASNGLIGGTVGRLVSGSYNLSFQVTDATGATSPTQSLTLTLNGITQVLGLSKDSSAIANNSTLMLSAATIGGSGSSTTYRLRNLSESNLDLITTLTGAEPSFFTLSLRNDANEAITRLASNGEANLTLSFKAAAGSSVGFKNANLQIGTAATTFLTFGLQAHATGPLSFSTGTNLGLVGRGKPVSLALSAQGGFGNLSFQKISGQLPPGLNLSSDGNLTGTVPTAGDYNFIILVKDSSTPPLSAIRNFTLSVLGINLRSQKKVILNGAAAVINLDLRASGGQAPYSYALVNRNHLPDSIDLSNGVLAGSSNVAGSYAIDVRVTDKDNNSNLESLSLSLFGITTPASQPITIGRAASLTLSSAGGEGSVTWSAPGPQQLPAGLSLNGNSGEISGQLDSPLTSSVNIQATDGSGSIATLVLSLSTRQPDLQISDISRGEEFAIPLRSNDRLIMAACAPGNTVTQTLRLQNNGTAEITLTDRSFTPASAGDFTAIFSKALIPQLALPLTLEANESCLLQLRFSPSRGPGITRRSSLQIQTDSSLLPTFNLALQAQCLNRPRLLQAIRFIAPNQLHVGQGAVRLHAYAVGSGLPVKLTASKSTAANLQGNPTEGYVLTPQAAGTITLSATQDGDAAYAPARPVSFAINISPSPSKLTLTNLLQVYDGGEKAVTVLPANLPAEELSITYSQGKTVLPAGKKPTQAGRYAVVVVHRPSGGNPVTATATMVIAKAVLLITAEAKQRRVLEANPPLTYRLRTQRNAVWVDISDNEAFWTTKPGINGILNQPQLATRAVTSSPAGVYPITLANRPVSLNYQPVFVDGSLCVEGFGSSHQAMISSAADGRPVGLLNLSTTGFKSLASKIKGQAPTLRATFTASLWQRLNPATPNASFSGEFELSDNGEALTIFGNNLSHPASGMSLSGIQLERDGTLRGTLRHSDVDYPFTGSRLLEPSESPQAHAGKYTLLLESGLVVSAEGNRKPTLMEAPLGQGYASIDVDAKGWLRLSGVLGDGKGFTAALPADISANPCHRLFVQPYARKDAFIAGSFELLRTSDGSAMRHVPAASLYWWRPEDPEAVNDATGFELTTTARIDPWLAPDRKLRPLHLLLGQSNCTLQVSNPIEPGAGDMLNGTLQILATNLAHAEGSFTLNPKTGFFTGSRRFISDGSSKSLSFAGCLRMPANSTESNRPECIGGGILQVPSATNSGSPLTGCINLQR